MSRKRENILQLAYVEATKSPCLHKHGCVACINGKIISRGCNNYITRPNDKFCPHGASCHAEIQTLRNIWLRKKHLSLDKQYKHFKKITIYVVRISSSGFMNSAPCMDCTQKLKELNIKQIVYSNNLGGTTICKTINYHNDKQTRARSLIQNDN
jgi:deoxycytidylate deaminase